MKPEDDAPATPDLREMPPAELGVEYFDDDTAILHFSLPTVERPAGLSDGEWDILQRIVAGSSNAQIATARGTSVRTVANQISVLFEKLGVSDRVGAARKCLRFKRATRS